jgi:energy-coupling factor transporter ATP-binding protein EcfA2
MIDRVHFENFKSLKDVTLDLGRLTVLVGPNGCGKSSVLQGIELLAQTGVEREGERQWVLDRFFLIFGGARDPARIANPGRPTTMVFSMRESGGDELTLHVPVPAPNGGNPDNRKRQFEVYVEGSEGSLEVTVPAQLGEDAKLAVLNHPRVKQFASAVYLHLDSAKMTETSIPDAERSTMASDGSQLASALAWMKGAAEEELAKATSALQEIVPGVKLIRTLREQVRNQRMEKIDIDGQPVWRPVAKTLLGDRFEIEFDNGSSVPADLLSEGTVLALGLLTKLHEPERPRLVLLDDIDRGLHIEAQTKLVAVLRDLMKLDPELQIVCTTHSPYLLDRFEASEVRVLELDESRHTHALPLTEHPEFGKWKFGTQTGELWAALGSAWVAGLEGLPR